MKLLTDKPLDEYFKKIKRREIEVLTIASPFITGPGVRYISNYAKSKLVRVRVLTNLSKFNLLRSLDNPIRPLVELSESLGENLEIKSSPKLHAKLFLADASVALHGSSNLTLGGGESNHELNMLVLGGTVRADKHIVELTGWFDSLWKEAAQLDEKELIELEGCWQSNLEKLLANFKGALPECRLAGQQWDKVKELSRKSHSKDKALEILMEQGAVRAGEKKSKPANATSKLLFLEEQGIVKVEKGRVLPIRKISKVGQMTEILAEALPCYRDVVATIKKKEEVTYDELFRVLGASKEEQIKAIVLWLEDLGLVSRAKHGRGPDFFVWQGADS